MNETITLPPIIRFSPQKWAVKREKSIRYKIGDKRKYYKSSGLTNSGKKAFVYDYGDKLRFTFISYNKSGDKWNNNVKPVFFILRAKEGKCRLYSVSREDHRNNRYTLSVRDSSNRMERLENTLDSWFNAGHGDKSKTKVNKRLNKILIAFFKRNNIKFKYTDRPTYNILCSCYPVLRELPVTLHHPSLSSIYTRFLLRGDFKDVVKKAFGVNSKALTKLVCDHINQTKSLSCLATGPLLKNLIPFDYYIQNKHYLALGHHFDSHLQRDFKNVRNLLKHYNPQRIKKIFDSTITLGAAGSRGLFNYDSVFQTPFSRLYGLIDAARSYERYPQIVLPEKPKNVDELHDEILEKTQVIYRQNRDKQELASSFELKTPKSLEKIKDKELDDLKFIVPQSSYELGQWGQKLHNCIAGYAHSVRDGQCQILGILKDNVLTYALEIRDKKIIQFKTFCNQEPIDSEREKVLKFLIENSIIKEYKTYTSEVNYAF